MQSVHGFKLVSTKPYDLISGFIKMWKHEKTGALVAQFECSDTNKAFGIGFRTPPTRSDGVAHILEHSVLCGSEKYPGKEPFASLLRSSVNTFLNAMTYPDRTIYPFASQNEKDFFNVMSVYLDAVFKPRIYDEPMIFAKEGHHVELNENNEAYITGVVYNEMRGAMSAPDRMLSEAIDASLYKNAYGFNSGGDPKSIELLTYEEFCQFHRDHYHPSNSFSFLYGDCEFSKVAAALNEYFEQYEYRECDYVVPDTELFEGPCQVVLNYPAASKEDRAYMSLNYLLGSDDLSPQDATALNILFALMLDNPSSKLQQRLMKEGLSGLSYSYLKTYHKQPSCGFYFHEVPLDQQERLKEVVLEEFAEFARTGFNKAEIHAALNRRAFSIREGDFDSEPKGLVLGLEASNALTYGRDVYSELDYNAMIAGLRAELEAGSPYFENLFLRTILENTACVWVTMLPEEGLLEKNAQIAQERAQKKIEGKTPEELEEIRAFQETLAAYAVAPDSPEDEALIPRLDREDISVQHVDYHIKKNSHGLHRSIESNHINYMQLAIALTPEHQVDSRPGYVAVSEDELPLLSLLCKALGFVRTEHYTCSDLNTKSLELLGSHNFYVGMHKIYDKEQTVSYNPEREDGAHFRSFWICSSSYLEEFSAEALDLLEEILYRSDFDDYERLSQVLELEVSKCRSELVEMGHIICRSRLAARFSSGAALSEQLQGLSYYEALKSYKELDIKELAQKLKALYERLLQGAQRFVYLAGTGDKTSELVELAQRFQCPEYQGMPEACEPIATRLPFKHEGIALQTEVNYVGVAGPLVQDLSFSGAAHIMRKLLAGDYLWTRIRLEGGAYGCMHGANSNFGSIVSYRDPNLAKSYEVYDNIPSFIDGLELSDRDFTDRILSAISYEQMPKTPQQIQATALSCEISELDLEVFTNIQEEMLSCDLAEVKSLSQAYKHMLENQLRCTVASKAALEKEIDMFDCIIEVK